MIIDKIGIIKYGLGNIASVENATNSLGFEYEVITNPNDLYKYKSLVLPGVGNFSKAMSILNADGWTENIFEAVITYKKPILGICLGMQLLASFGYEGEFDSSVKIKGLGLIEGEVKNLYDIGCIERVPHMGWNNLINLKTHNIVKGIEPNTDFYFVHSFAFVPENKNHLIASVDYSKNLTAIVAKEQIWGVQFHPEKSSKAGFQVLKNFFNYQLC
tara:strand:+ start:1135 stop:1782 length:648 start_codon:yes stop_codon:yes gene_type:complete